MSGTEDRDSDARDAAAAEYVLGTATAHEAAAIERAMASSPALATAVAEWEELLDPLTKLAIQEAPPPGLWAAIETQIAPSPAVSAPKRDGWRSRFLSYWAGGATTAALALAAFILFRTPPAPPLMTVMVADRTQTAWSALVEPNGALSLAAITPAAGTPSPVTPAERVMQLWALPPGATGPTSLAVLAPGQRAITLPAPAVRPVAGMLIEITLEPQGGSPIGRPTGPVLFIGRLSQPGGNT